MTTKEQAETTIEAQLPKMPIRRYFGIRDRVIENTRKRLIELGHDAANLSPDEVTDLSIEVADRRGPVMAGPEDVLRHAQTIKSEEPVYSLPNPGSGCDGMRGMICLDDIMEDCLEIAAMNKAIESRVKGIEHKG